MLRPMGKVGARMDAYLHMAGIGLLAVAALAVSAPAQALEFGEWQVNLADLAHYAEPGQFVETPSVCTALWEGDKSYLLIALLPGGDRLVQASGQSWNHFPEFGAATLAIGSVLLPLDQAIYGRQFVDHVTPEASGGIEALETMDERLGALTDAPTTVQYLDQRGGVLLEAPFEGFLDAIDSLLVCRHVVYGE